jgi:hypothetical protein
MTGFFVLALLWAAFLGYIAVTPKDRMQMTWLVLVGLALVAPLLAWIWPALR